MIHGPLPDRDGQATAAAGTGLAAALDHGLAILNRIIVVLQRSRWSRPARS